MKQTVCDMCERIYGPKDDDEPDTVSLPQTSARFDLCRVCQFKVRDYINNMALAPKQ